MLALRPRPVSFGSHAAETNMTLAATDGNKKEAALKLGISRRALYNKLKKHGTL